MDFAKSMSTRLRLWSLLSLARPHRGVSQEKLFYLGLFEFVHNVRKRGKALLGALIELLVTPTPETQDEPFFIKKESVTSSRD